VVKLQKLAGVYIGTDHADTTNFWATVLTDKIYGGAADMWGLTFTPAEINASTFG
jgi:hypothetical protein